MHSNDNVTGNGSLERGNILSYGLLADLLITKILTQAIEGKFSVRDNTLY